MNTKNLFFNIKNNKLILTGIICFFLAFLSFAYFIIQGDGFFIIRDDFNEQQIPFTIGLHNSIINSGLSGFSWCVDLGTSTLQAYSFYELGSPFFWISMLFPPHFFPYIVAWIYMLKYSLAGVFSFIFLKRFSQDEKWAVIGAILYAFSGFSTVNLMYYHFHDVVAFFPLLLIGLEILIEKGDCRLFIFSVFINAFLNYFFFIGEAVFLVFYYLFRFGKKDIKKMISEIIKCLSCAILGVGMSCLLFIPNILYIRQNSRSHSNFSFEGLFNDIRYLLFNLKGLIIPAESMPDMSAIFPSKFYSTAAYLPMIGLSLVIAYIIKNRDWLSRLLIFCLIGAFWPLIGSSFFLYMDSQNRWWHALVLMMALASIKVIENIDLYKKELLIGAIINLLLILFLFLFVWFIFKDPAGESTIYSPIRFLLYCSIAIIGIISTIICIYFFKNRYKTLLLFISVFAIFTTTLTLYFYRSHGKNVTSYRETFDLACQIEIPNEQYRLNNGSNVISMVNNISGFSLFTSTDSIGITSFEYLFDYIDSVNGLNKNTYSGLSELLGGKYYLTSENDDNPTIATYKSNNIIYYLKESIACPIGFKVDSYITEDELTNISVENRAIALMQAAVVSKDDSKKLENLQEKTSTDIDCNAPISDLVEKANTGAVLDFKKDGKGFSCTSSYKDDSTIYFSVPYDKGWSATVDDKSASIVESGGMMLLNVPSGNHNISFKYITPGYNIGLLISIISWILFIIYLIFPKIKASKMLA